MDVLARITELRLMRNWSEYRFSQESGIPQSTISSWYRRNQFPSISTLENVCHAFGITMSQFFLLPEERFVSLSDQQYELLKKTEGLSKQQITSLIDFLETMRLPSYVHMDR